MARYAITIITIAAITLATSCRLSPEPTELTVLTYNTHLFEDSPLECIVRCGGLKFWKKDRPKWAGFNYDDGGRRSQIVNRIRASGADIVALQEVWAIGYREWLKTTLSNTYPYSYHLDSSCNCHNALRGISSVLPACITINASFPTLYLPAGGPDYHNRLHTEGNGLILLSKWPLQDLQFTRFPAFNCDLKDPETECWADKGVVTATVNVGGAPIRIGISHALTGPDDYKSKWEPDYVATAITTFQLNGQAHIFALDKNNQAHIRRFEDYSYFDEASQTQKHGAGWKHLYAGPWGSDHIAVTSFQLNGHPYLFGVNSRNEGHIERINDDGKGWTNMPSYTGIRKRGPTGGPAMWRLNPWDSEAWPHWGPDYIAVKSFEMNGHPYLFAMKNCCAQNTAPCGQPLPGEAYLKRINDDPNTGWEDLYQLEDMKIIRDATVAEDGPPTIMMGDFNIHRGKYGIMDQLFRKAGAVDAYVEVHGTGEGGETVDWFENQLYQYFWPDENPANPDLVDRIDYVYVKQSGAGLKLVPTEAYVIRNWKYGDNNMDLSDHYPLFVKFRLEAQ